MSNQTLIALCHNFNRGAGLLFGCAQHGQRDNVLTRPTMRRRRSVGMELTTWRSGLSGGASGSITLGNGRSRDDSPGSIS